MRPTWGFGWETPGEAVLSRGQQYASYQMPAAPSDEDLQCLPGLGMDSRRNRRPVKGLKEKAPLRRGFFLVYGKLPENINAFEEHPVWVIPQTKAPKRIGIGDTLHEETSHLEAQW